MIEEYLRLKTELEPRGVNILAVSKTHSPEKIMQLYNLGQRDFGENRVQEMVEKRTILPHDIRWHQIGHLQKNKVKYIAPWVSLIHSVDDLDLLTVINREGEKCNRVISILLQIKIAEEDTKYGLLIGEALNIFQVKKPSDFKFIKFEGVMGMASFTEDISQLEGEYKTLIKVFHQFKREYFAHDDDFRIISGGMSGDYKIAIESGCNMVRLGSIIFGQRNSP